MPFSSRRFFPPIPIIHPLLGRGKGDGKKKKEGKERGKGEGDGRTVIRGHSFLFPGLEED